MPETFTLRWGILATGGIAKTFADDISIPAASRSIANFAHKVTAVGSSTSIARAREFLSSINALSTASAYGSYNELAADPNVDIIYIASPHSHHFQHTMLCLRAGKNVLCEKPMTVNAMQTKELIELARKKGLFLMEALWTRCLPTSTAVESLVTGGRIGKIHRVLADLSYGDDVEQKWGTEHRMVNMDLAGGALLDLGIYSLFWVFNVLSFMQGTSREVPRIKSFMSKYHLTGTDETTTTILEFPQSKAHGVALTSIRVSTDPGERGISGPAVKIQGTKGEIQISHPAFRPEHFRIISRAGVVEDIFLPIEVGRGLYFEADEAARCIMERRKESDMVPLEQTLLIMEALDEIRRQGNLKFPNEVESTDET